MFIIDNIPNGITEYDFLQWIYKANKVLNQFDSTWCISDHKQLFSKIIFSKDKLRKKYGLFTWDEIKNSILNAYNIDEESVDEAIESFKKSGYPVINDATGRLASKIVKQSNYEHDNEDKWREVQEKLIKLFHNAGFECNVLGEFNIKNKTIVLYVDSIKEHATNVLISFNQAIEQVFIHELFHAFHYKDNNEELLSRSDYTSEVITESLASFFEYIYTNMFIDSITASKIEKSWKEYTPYSYPYSGALRFKYNHNFSNIFNISLTNMDNALRELLYSSLFYRIKNKVIYKEISIIDAIDSYTKKYNTKYEYNGKTGLGKGKLVLEVINKYCDDHKGITFEELNKVFPHTLVNNGKRGLVELECNVSDKEKGLNGGHKRYFTDESIILENGEVVLINNQWSVFNIEKFIDYCKNVLKIDDIKEMTVLMTFKKNISQANYNDKNNNHIYLEYSEGFQSFRILDKHVNSYVIDDHNCTISYGQYGSVSKVINNYNYNRLINLFDKYYSLLSIGNEDYIKSHHGTISTYKYKFREKTNMPCGSHLFDGEDNLVNQAYKEFEKIYKDIIEQ